MAINPENMATCIEFSIHSHAIFNNINSLTLILYNNDNHYYLGLAC